MQKHKVLLVEFNKGALVSFFLLNKVLLSPMFGFESVGWVCVSNFSLSPFYSLKRGRCRWFSKTPGRDSAFLPLSLLCLQGTLILVLTVLVGVLKNSSGLKITLKRYFSRMRIFLSLFPCMIRGLWNWFLCSYCVCVCMCLCIYIHVQTSRKGKLGRECDKELRMGFSDAFLLLGVDGGFLCRVIPTLACHLWGMFFPPVIWGRSLLMLES